MRIRRIIANIAALAVLAAVVPAASCAPDSNQNREQKNEKTVSTPVIPELKSEDGLPVVVDFYADWCGPCVQFRPIFHAAEKAYSGKVEFKAINVDNEQNLAQRLGIESIPTIMFITKDGREAGRFTGMMSAGQLHQAVDSLLSI